MIDISDGLAADLGHILTESRVGAVIEEGGIPRRQNASLIEALYDGEDFELLFTVSPSKAKNLKASTKGRFTFYRIGTIVTQGLGVQLKKNNGVMKRLKRKGYTHF
jgi:thiamine-monophosphate kinase